MAAASVDAGRRPPRVRPHRMEVGGVGRGSVHTEEAWEHDIALPTVQGTSEDATYDAPVVDSDTMPGLLGLKTQKRLKAIIDTDHYRMIVPGPGGVKIQCSPGTIVYQGYPTVSGHFMIPCTEFDRRNLPTPSSRTTVLLSGNTVPPEDFVPGMSGPSPENLVPPAPFSPGASGSSS